VGKLQIIYPPKQCST